MATYSKVHVYVKNEAQFTESLSVGNTHEGPTQGFLPLL